VWTICDTSLQNYQWCHPPTQIPVHPFQSKALHGAEVYFLPLCWCLFSPIVLKSIFSHCAEVYFLPLCWCLFSPIVLLRQVSGHLKTPNDRLQVQRLTERVITTCTTFFTVGNMRVQRWYTPSPSRFPTFSHFWGPYVLHYRSQEVKIDSGNSTKHLGQVPHQQRPCTWSFKQNKHHLHDKPQIN